MDYETGKMLEALNMKLDFIIQKLELDKEEPANNKEKDGRKQ